MQHMETGDTGSDRIELLATSQEKVLLMRDATTERIKLSERDTLFVLDLLENPPPPNAKLIAAMKAWADNQKKLEEMQ